jgi:ABC-2 type transport system permease protein
MQRLFKFLIRISSFISKELTEILRQPRLILTLVLGPFLIMFLFGLGYPEQNRTLRTTFVAEDPADLEGNMELFTGSASPPDQPARPLLGRLSKMIRNWRWPSWR